jgi:hypothetical protein
MRSDVRELAGAVPRRGNHLAVADDHGADRNLAAFAGGLGFAERLRHEMRAGRVHLASKESVC